LIRRSALEYFITNLKERKEQAEAYAKAMADLIRKHRTRSVCPADPLVSIRAGSGLMIPVQMTDPPRPAPDGA
jgi:hypothetical protein